ncbi:hypothetical protein ACS0TY_005642 [Phlomoides rotata]
MEEDLESPTADEFHDDMDSCCSTPYVSAPSSPGRAPPLSGFYYSAPASPMHFVLSSTALKSYPSAAAVPLDSNTSFEFDFSSTLPSTAASSPENMTSADELFFNGQIRPMKLSTHLQRPQLLGPLIESDDEQAFSRGRELKFRAGSLRRRTRSMSPMRSPTTTHHWKFDTDTEREKSSAAGEEKPSDETTPRSSSAGRSSKRWIFLKEFLYRSKSEGRSELGHKFWGSLSFSPVKEKEKKLAVKEEVAEGKKKAVKSKRRGVLPSAHEVHYTAKRAQAEELRKKTFLPYRQGLFGCLGISSKSYGAMNGFARAFGTVSSR